MGHRGEGCLVQDSEGHKLLSFVTLIPFTALTDSKEIPQYPLRAVLSTFLRM